MSKQFDTSGELLIQRVGGGIQLIRPEQALDANLYSVNQLLEMPFDVYFINSDSIILSHNEHSAKSCGFISLREAIGKSVKAVARQETVESLLEQTNLVLTSNNMMIKDFSFHRIRDESPYTKVVIKFPWYGKDHKLLGIFGCSIVIGSESTCSFSHALTLLTQTGLLSNPSIKPVNSQPVLCEIQVGSYHFTKREKDVLQQIAYGKTAKQIALRLGISHRTVEEYVTNLKAKVGVDSKSALTEKITPFFKNLTLPPSQDIFIQ